MNKKGDIVKAWSHYLTMIYGIKEIVFKLNKCKTFDRKSWDSFSLNRSFVLAGNPSRYLEIGETDVLINGVSWSQLATEAADVARAGNYHEFGSKYA